MLKQLSLDLKLYKKDLWIALALTAAAFLVGFGTVTMVMLLVDDPGSWVTMGTFFAWGSLIMCAIVQFAKYYQQFMLALSMGQTRTGFLVSYAVRSLLNVALCYGLVVILYRVELGVGTKLFAPWPLEIDPTFIVDWRMIAAALLGTVILSMFVGSLYSYFGKKAMVPLYFLWIGSMLSGSRLSWVWNLLPGAVWAGLGIGVVVAMVATILILGKKQMVK
jgi:hypothetical protein